MNFSRRDFLFGAGALALAPSLGAMTLPGEDSFSFVHFTDIHIEPEMKATEGSISCFDRINAARPDFALCGGDLVFDSGAVPRERGLAVFDLYFKTSGRLAMPIHTIPGNHDIMGLTAKSRMAPSDPLYGKKLFEDRVGPRYSAFEHKGWHFILLDSIGLTPQRDFIGLIDEEEMQWLRGKLREIGPTKPIVIMTHIPLVSGALQVIPDAWKTVPKYLITNSVEVLAAIEPYNVKAVLQGHTHICENLMYKGCQFITSGAVCGNWWKGRRCGFENGFAVLTVKGDDITWRYEPYDFVPVQPA